MTLPHDVQYLALANTVMQTGTWKENRTGVDATSSFGHQMKFNLRDGTIPLLTTKKMHTKSIIRELLWYLHGTGNIKYMQDNGVRIWNEWADSNGDLGRVYGVQWRSWRRMYGGYIDQIAVLIDKLRNNPDDRRMLVTAWNVDELDLMALPPCHYAFQCYTRPLSEIERVRLFAKQFHVDDLMTSGSIQASLDAAGIPSRELSLQMHQRSVDVFLGLPFNIAQYSLLMRMLGEITNMVPGDLVWTGGDVHVYDNHRDQLTEQLSRTPFPSPTMSFSRNVEDIDDFDFDDFQIVGYTSHPPLSAAVAV